MIIFQFGCGTKRVHAGGGWEIIIHMTYNLKKVLYKLA